MTSYHLWYVVQSAEVARLDQKENLLSNNHLSGEWVPARRRCLFPLQLMLIFHFHFFREEKETYCRWFRNPARKPVEVGSFFPIIYKVFSTIPGGWPWDFWLPSTV